MKMNELKPKLFDVLKDYSKEQAMRDVISGIIVAIIALPLSIALAIASGVGPEQGLYTAIIAGFFISFFGGSRVQIGGPTAAFVVIIYGIVADYGTAGLTVATILAGIFLIVMGICHFGSLIKYIPYTITTGFTCGIAVTLFVGQLKDFFGLSIASVPSGFVDKVIAYATNISTINWTATAVGAAAIVIMLLWPKVTDKIPGSLIAIIVTTAVVYFAKLPVNTIGSVYGELSSSFPTPHVPALSMKLVQEMLSPAFTIALLAGIESLLSAVVSDGMIGDTHKSNAELIGQGLGNIFSGIFGGIPATGAIARTAANVRNGGRTPIAGIVHCITLTIILLVLSVICFPASHAIISLFRRNDPVVIEIGTLALRMQLLTLPLQGTVIMGNMMPQSIGYGFRATLVSTARQGIFLIPLLIVLTLSLGLLGIQCAQPLADIATFLLALFVIRGIFKEFPEDVSSSAAQ